MLADVGRHRRVWREAFAKRAQNRERMHRVVTRRRLGQGVLFAQRIHAREPVRTCGLTRSRQKCVHECSRIADDAHVDATQLTDLTRIDVDVDGARTRTELAELARRAIVEAHADREQQIALVQEHVGVRRRVHTEHAAKQRMRWIERTEPHQAAHHRQLLTPRELCDELVCSRA
jgi:hypothetical protein